MVEPAMVRSRRLLLLLALVAGAALVALLALRPLGGPAPAEGGGLIGRDAPSLRIDGVPPPTLEGAPVDLESLRGRVVWLNFWTTSCVPCRTEMPPMQRLAEDYADDGLTVIGIDVGEGANSVQAFVDELGVRYPIVLDVDSTIFNRYSPLFGVPRHYFVGRDGTIVAARIGELRPDEMEPLITELLAH
jgi:thiol-disulfide isomerase/thioredoxin